MRSLVDARQLVGQAGVINGRRRGIWHIEDRPVAAGDRRFRLGFKGGFMRPIEIAQVRMGVDHALELDKRHQT